MWKFVVIFVAVLVHSIEAYPDGAVCRAFSGSEHIKPHSPHSAIKNDDHFAQLQFSRRRVSPGSIVTITIKSMVPFKGFAIEASKGYFVNLPVGTKALTCGNDGLSRVTHDNAKSSKNQIVLRWRAPMKMTKAHFRVTLVTNREDSFLTNEDPNQDEIEVIRGRGGIE